MGKSGLFLLDEIRTLERVRSSKVVVYYALAGPTKRLSTEDIPVLCRCLEGAGARELPLDLVLCTEGGYPATAGRLAALLREFSRTVRVLVPHRCRSAGTLVALAADSLVMGRLGELSPVDPLVQLPGARGHGRPVSSEDMKCIKEMGADWFGIDRRAMARALCAHFTPAVLASFYRAERYIQEMCVAHLRHLLPRATAATRRRIAKHLIHGFSDHMHAIDRQAARALGLEVADAAPEEERALTTLLRACERRIYEAAQSEATPLGALIASEGMCAEYVCNWRALPDKHGATAEGPLNPRMFAQAGSWRDVPGSRAEPSGEAGIQQ